MPNQVVVNSPLGGSTILTSSFQFPIPLPAYDCLAPSEMPTLSTSHMRFHASHSALPMRRGAWRTNSTASRLMSPEPSSTCQSRLLGHAHRRNQIVVVDHIPRYDHVRHMLPCRSIVSAQGITCFRPAGAPGGFRINQPVLMVSIDRMVTFARTAKLGGAISKSKIDKWHKFEERLRPLRRSFLQAGLSLAWVSPKRQSDLPNLT